MQRSDRTTTPLDERGGEGSPRRAGPPFLRSVAVLATMAVAGGAATGEYTIRPGDTLSEIAVRHGTTSSRLAAVNGLADRHRVVAGRTLTIPGGGTTTASSVAGSYTVRPGDTLSTIAARLGTTTRALASANGITNQHRVVAGRRLSVPGGGVGGSAPRAVAAAGYTVRSGDTLSHIAVRNGVSVAALARANGITNRDRLSPGRLLNIPAATAAPAPSAAAATVSAPAGLPARLRSSPDRLAYLPIFRRWAAQYGVPADLLMAMTWLESGWQRNAVSSTGAIGVGQIMPATTKWMEEIVIREPLDPRDPDDSIRMSARYLRWLLDRTGGNVRNALGGYYQGLQSVRTRGLLAETERYVDNVLAFRDRHF